MSTREAVVAVRRFGLGARPGELDRLGGDARGFLLASLARKDAALIRDPGLEPSHVVFANAQQARVATQTLKAFGEAGGTAAKAKTSAPDAPSPAGNAMTDAEAVAHGKGQAQTKRQPEAMTVAPETPAQIRRTAFQREMAARMEQARTTEGAFVERLVMFWSNHFCVSALKGGAVRAIAGCFEREAIRPHVLGRFADMLLAGGTSPAKFYRNASTKGGALLFSGTDVNVRSSAPTTEKALPFSVGNLCQLTPQ